MGSRTCTRASSVILPVLLVVLSIAAFSAPALSQSTELSGSQYSRLATSYLEVPAWSLDDWTWPPELPGNWTLPEGPPPCWPDAWAWPPELPGNWTLPEEPPLCWPDGWAWPPPTTPVTRGDANIDGIVDMGDVTTVEMQILGRHRATLTADADMDGRITMWDVTGIERIILELD